MEAGKSVSKLNVTLASDVDGWNKTVNGQLVIELGRNDRLCVTGFVPNNTQQQREHASSLNIQLVDSKAHDGFSSADLLSFPPDNLNIDILFIHCHGENLGRQAQVIKDLKKCKWVQVVHSFHEECHIAGYEDEHKLQTKMCEKADAVIAIGPKTAESCRRALLFSRRQENVINLTPGICEDLIGAHQLHKDWTTFHVLISGSLRHFNIKGCDIAAKAIKLLNTPSYHLTVAVKSSNETADIRKALLKEGIDSRQLTVCVAESREDWRKLVCKVDLAIKPSRNEGFGMSGLLAISADLPVLISDCCGLGIVLKTVLFGNSHVVDSDESQVWADRIKQVRNRDPELRHKEAKQLRDGYTKKFSWKNQCEEVVAKLSKLVQKSEQPAEKQDQEETVKNLAKRIQDTSLSDKSSISEVKDPKKKFDMVDAGRTQVNERLLMSVKDIPLPVYSRVCVSLNVLRNVRFDDFRMLGDKVGLSRDEIEFVGQQGNPADEILKTWSSRPREATVAKLIELLKDKDFGRMDVVQIVEDWVSSKER